MASPSDRAEMHRLRQSLRAPHALGGRIAPPGYQNRKDRRARQSTAGRRAAAAQEAHDMALMRAATNEPQER